MILARIIQQFVISILLAFMLVGCSTKRPIVNSNVQSLPLKSRPEKSISQLGAEMQRAGIMSQKDYIRIVNLGHKTSHTHNLSQEDFAWTLSLLATANNSLARARAMTVLAYINPMSSSQKAKLTAAIAPFINSSDPLDAAYASRVQESIQKN